MHCKLKMGVFIIACAAIWGCSKSGAQIEEKKARDLLVSADFRNRNQGVFILSKLYRGDFKLGRKTINQIIQTLNDEIQIKKSFEEQAVSEGKGVHQMMEEFGKKYPHREHTDYLDSLVSLVAGTRDPKGIPVIFQFIRNGGYVFDDAVLAGFGNPAFDFLVDRVVHGLDDERELAMSMLSFWINPPKDSDHIDTAHVFSLTTVQKQKLEPIFLQGTEESNLQIKYYTIRGLGAFLDKPEIKKKLLELAKNGETAEIRLQAERIMSGF